MPRTTQQPKGIRGLIKKKVAMTLKLEGISFWAHQFSEHFEFIIDILKGNRDKVEVSRELMAKLRFMQARWARISSDPELFLQEDLDKTLELKQEVKHLVSHLPCIPDLLTHMIEEALYFKNSILNEEYTLQDEISYWATEHSENIDFVGCQLPELIKQDGGRIPPWLNQAFKKNKVLSDKFKTVASENEAGFLSGLTSLFGFGKSDGQTSMKDLDHFLDLKVQHLKGLDGLISKIPELPLNPKTQKELFEMVEHERHEAIFAFERVKMVAAYAAP